MKWSFQKILIHFLSWIVFLTLPFIASPNFSFFRPLEYGVPEIRNLISSALIIIFFYVNYYYFIPDFYYRKKYILFTFIALICFLFIVIIPSLTYPDLENFQNQAPPIHPFSVQFTSHPHALSPERHAFHIALYQLESTILKFLIIFVLSILIKTRELWKHAQEEKLINELSYLKLQVNPHFLFNTLNSIYSLALEKSDNTPTAIVKLSELMRYVTSEVNNDFVPLVKEVNYIFNYIELQRIRLEETVQIDYKVSGIYNKDRIAPLLLIPFIENAFKFGINPEISSMIKIQLNIDNHQLTMIVFNKKVSRNAKLMESGTGLRNVQKRLQLIYPEEHTLVIQESDQDFKIELTLHLI